MLDENSKSQGKPIHVTIICRFGIEKDTGCNPTSASGNSNEKDPPMVQRKHRLIGSITEKRNPEGGKKYGTKPGSILRSMFGLIFTTPGSHHPRMCLLQLSVPGAPEGALSTT
jgi:hypothetical protein